MRLTIMPGSTGSWIDRPRLFAAVVAMCVMSLSSARASDTIISFDDLPSGTQVSNQYHNQGVDLDTALGSGRLQFPVVAADPVARSPANVLDISSGYPNEFPGAYVQGKFSNPHHSSVGVWLHGRGNPGGPLTGSTTLRAFDLSGNMVGTGTAVAPVNGFVFLEVTAAAVIARFDVTCYNDLLFLDDLTFDELTGAPAPDFAVIASRVVLPVGGSGSTPVILRRFNGSVGDVLYSVGNLPPGVSVTGAVPNPMNGPDGSTAILTLSANSPATPVQDWPLTLIGNPSPSAGQFGPRSSSFPLIIVDSYDAQVVGIEVTQSVQLYDLPAGSVGNRSLHGVPVRYSGVPLASGGRTAVRVFPDFAAFPSSSPPPDFVCTLVGTRAGVALPGSPLVTSPGPNPMILGANYVDDLARARHISECDFVLPAAWTNGVISLVATINPQPVLGPPVSEECCTDNNSFTLTDIAFTPTRELHFAPFALRVNHAFLGFPDDVFAEAENTLPIGDSQFQMGDYVGEIDITDIWNQDVKSCGFLGTDSCAEDATGRGASANARLRNIADDLNFTDSGMLVVGIYPVSDSVTGLSDRIRTDTARGCTGPFWDCDNLQAIIVQNQLRPLTSVAHELGHMLGRVHASFGCGAGDTDNNGPAEHWLPDERGLLQSVGVDRFSFRVWFPDRSGGALGGPFYDFMSYCANPNDAGDPDAWISARGWVETIQNLATGAPGSEARPLAVASLHRPAPTDLQEMMIVQGFIDLQGNVSVTKIAEERRLAKPVPQSPFELVVHGSAGSVLGRQTMEAVAASAHHEGMVTFLAAQVPVTGFGAEAIEILKDGKPIARRERDKQAPVVYDVDVHRRELHDACAQHGASAPAGCGDEDDDGLATVVTWHTKYAGMRPLQVKVDYSANGSAIWRPVFLGPDQGRVVLRNTMLVPSRIAQVRVRVTDGFNAATAISPVFHEPGGRPVLHIISPVAGAQVPSGQMIYLRGVAYDTGHQLMRAEQMSWYAGDRKLGTGQTLSLPALPPGETAIRLVVLDPDGHPVERSAILRVVPR